MISIPKKVILCRVAIIQSSHAQGKVREGVVLKKEKGNEYQIRFDDGLLEVINRSVLDSIEDPGENGSLLLR